MRRAGRVRISGLVGLIVLVGTPFALWAQTVTETDELIGTVLDAATGAPVANATIWMEVRAAAGASVTAPQRGGVLTGADGRFRLGGVPAGLVVLHVEHIAYGRHAHPLEVDGEGTGLVLISVSPVAIELEPVLVDAESTWGLGGRSSPSSRNVIPRSVIAASASSGVSLGDFLGREVAGIYMRRSAQVGGAVCIEFRGARREDGLCRPPEVYMDGTAVPNPLDLFGYLSLDGLERIQVVSAAEAGTRFGPNSGWGVLLLETRRTGPEVAPGIPLVRRRVEPLGAVDWSYELTPYPWARVYVTAFAGNALGLAAASAVMSQCMDLGTRRFYRGDDACGAGLLLASGVVMSVLPALGGALGARFGGATSRSLGRLGRSMLYSVPAFVPGFAMASINSGRGGGPGSRDPGSCSGGGRRASPQHARRLRVPSRALDRAGRTAPARAARRFDRRRRAHPVPRRYGASCCHGWPSPCTFGRRPVGGLFIFEETGNDSIQFRRAHP